MITNIARAWAFDPGIVTITSTNTLLQCLADGYLTTQAEAIAALNNGDFEFRFGDLVALSASDTSVFLKFVGIDFTTMVLADGAGDTGLVSVSVLNSPGTSTLAVPAGTTYIYYELAGGGGGGGGAVDGGGAATFAAGGGGGAGGYNKGFIFSGGFPFIIGNITYTVASGGAGGIGSAVGGAGGSSTFTVVSLSDTVTCAGGSGGAGSTGLVNTVSSFVAGGSGGGASGSLSRAGGNGFCGAIMNGAVCSGYGGSGGAGNGGGSVITGSNGIIGNGSGAGGSGAARLTTGTSNGGPGNSGILYLAFYGLAA